MKPLPPPGTFAEGQRLIYGLLAAAAGMFCGALRGGDDRASDVGRLVAGPKSIASSSSSAGRWAGSSPRWSR